MDLRRARVRGACRCGIVAHWLTSELHATYVVGGLRRCTRTLRETPSRRGGTSGDSMRASLIARFAIGLLVLTGSVAVAASDVEPIDIPFTRFVLPNGLTVVVSEDHKSPVVAVSVWYHVGSANEPAGKTGFAHLFEHLMFQGSENHDGEFF